jgi:cytochrome c peroxidase
MKNWLHGLIILILIVSLMIMLGWQYRSREHSAIEVEALPADISNEPISPLPLSSDVDKRKVALGEQLFSEPRLSHDNTISCASCHSLTTGGTDQLVRSVGIGGQTGAINAPTVFNSGLNFVQFWDGRAPTLEDQIDGPTHDRSEMGSTWDEILEKLRSAPDYVSHFSAIYADGIQRANVRDAIATFERSLITPNSRFDRYLRGERSAITSEELKGYRLFKDYGCSSCHQGANVGGNLFQKFGVMGDYFAKRGKITKADFGRFNVTKNEIDRHVFRVPTLRNIALTAPYFHDGSAPRLEDAVTVMGIYQLGRPLTPSETDAIVKFLKTLSGEYKGKGL